jgi:hypothetical protein
MDMVLHPVGARQADPYDDHHRHRRHYCASGRYSVRCSFAELIHNHESQSLTCIPILSLSLSLFCSQFLTSAAS